MTYREAIEYLNTFVNYERNTTYQYKSALNLKRVKGLLACLGDPQNGFKSIHVSGTKGKGSVCAFAAYILRTAGYKVGLYTSPHLYDIRERIRILKPLSGNNRNLSCAEFEGSISRKELSGLVAGLKPILEQYRRNCPYGPLSFFEVYTVLSFLYFKEKKIDFAVLETGLGGRLDATNVVEAGVCGISSISLDHTKLLGNSLTKIAGEKAGIIKRNKDRHKGRKPVVISAPQVKEVSRVIRNRCAKENAVLYSVGREIRYRDIKHGSKSQRFDLFGLRGEYRDLRIRMLGEHQVVNSALAVGLIESLAMRGQARIERKDIENGLVAAIWPGRFEIVREGPLVVLDGAHNDASAGNLRETLKKTCGGKDIIFVLGISRDKDIGGICRQFSPVGKKFILTRADNPRAAYCGQILQKLRLCKPGVAAFLSENVRDGLRLAFSKAGKGGVIVVTGSLFVVAEARRIILNNKGKYGQARS
ncbi:MAG: bifunctional folylpolyglutamate synthase/dihydrofolate synthase [Candidatus Omnitrophica bacterium]|nr:bifunctional folylpolyglutamate synthase/dihydrofolate synthase [Candidatus Omnitrophota bacterium]